LEETELAPTAKLLSCERTVVPRDADAIPVVATAPPFPDESFNGVAILYVLYHLSDPRLALAEAHRVMRQGGLIAVAVPSCHDSPELAHALPKAPLTFGAELAPGLLRELFEEPEVKR